MFLQMQVPGTMLLTPSLQRRQRVATNRTWTLQKSALTARYGTVETLLPQDVATSRKTPNLSGIEIGTKKQDLELRTFTEDRWSIHPVITFRPLQKFQAHRESSIMRTTRGKTRALGPAKLWGYTERIRTSNRSSGRRRTSLKTTATKWSYEPKKLMIDGLGVVACGYNNDHTAKTVWISTKQKKRDLQKVNTGKKLEQWVQNVASN